MSNKSTQPQAGKKETDKPDARTAKAVIPDRSNKTEVTLKAITRAVPLPPQKKRDEGLAHEITDWTKWVKENPQKACRLVKEWFDAEEG